MPTTAATPSTVVSRSTRIGGRASVTIDASARARPAASAISRRAGIAPTIPPGAVSRACAVAVSTRSRYATRRRISPRGTIGPHTPTKERGHGDPEGERGVEGLAAGRRRHDVAAVRRVRGALLVLVAVRGGHGQQPGGAHRRRPRRLLLHGALCRSGRSGRRAGVHPHRGRRPDPQGGRG